MMDKQKEFDAIRLSDRILFALELALDQEDLQISEVLIKAVEMAMTRNTGGGEFVERRDYPPEVDKMMDRFFEMQKNSRSA